jgi:perosamine synthetase
MSTQSESTPESAGEFIPLSVPSLKGNEWQYVKECLDTNWVSSAGPFVDRFERMVADYVGASHAVATINGTSALHVALLAAGVCPGDEVLVSTLTFIASANAIRYAGAHPVFIDAEPGHWQIDTNLVEEFCRDYFVRRNGTLVNRATGRRVSAILPVHILGHPVDMPALLELAARYDLPVIEDAAESLGTRYGRQHVGTEGTAGCFSFNGNKTITTGGGGMLVTNDQQLAGLARYLTTQAKVDPLEYVHGEVGYNYRLSNVSAAIGCAQMEQLDTAIADKRRIAARYQRDLSNVAGIRMFAADDDAFCTYWLSTVTVDEEEFGCDSRTLLARLQKRNIQTRPLWQPLHQSPAHRGSYSVLQGVADRLHAECLSLPSSAGLTAAQQDRVIQAIVDARQGGKLPDNQNKDKAA